jgi:hypothetical protein
MEESLREQIALEAGKYFAAVKKAWDIVNEEEIEDPDGVIYEK